MKAIHILDLEFLEASDTIAAFLVETSAGPVLIESGPESTFAFLSLVERLVVLCLTALHITLQHPYNTVL